MSRRYPYETTLTEAGNNFFSHSGRNNLDETINSHYLTGKFNTKSSDNTEKKELVTVLYFVLLFNISLTLFCGVSEVLHTILCNLPVECTGINPCKAPPFSVKCGTWLATAWHRMAESLRSSEKVATRLGI